jgi:hypothetical protein
MLRPDYTAEVRRPTRWIAIALLMAATLTSAACFAVAAGVAIVGAKGVPTAALWGCLVVFGVLSGVCGWILIRLLRNARAENGRTTMPEWFIQIFGVILFVAICRVAIAEGRPLLFAEALGVALSMIGIRGLLRVPNGDDHEDENGEGKGEGG